MRHHLDLVWQWLTQPAVSSLEAAPTVDVIIACLHQNNDRVVQITAAAHELKKGKFVFASGAYAESIREKIVFPGFLFTDDLGARDLFSTLRNARKLIEDELPAEEFQSAMIVCPTENAQRVLGLWNSQYGAIPQLTICPPALPLQHIHENPGMIRPCCQRAVSEIRAIQDHIRHQEIAGKIPDIVVNDYLQLEKLLA